MKDTLDKLFGKKEDEQNVQEGGLNISDDTITPIEEENTSTDESNLTPQSDPVDASVSEGDNSLNLNTEDFSPISDTDIESKCEDCNNEAKDVELTVFIAELKELLLQSHGLDFELVELRRKINSLIDRHEAHN